MLIENILAKVQRNHELGFNLSEKEVINTEIYNGKFSLFIAVQMNDINLVTFLLFCGADVNKKNLVEKEGITALFEAIKNNNHEIIDLLIISGADINYQNNSLKTPLMHAVSCKNFQALKKLVRHGANLDIQDKNGNTALHYAYYKKQFDMMWYLIENGANPNIRNEMRYFRGKYQAKGKVCRTVADYAAISNDLKFLKKLVQKGADLSKMNFKDLLATTSELFPYYQYNNNSNTIMNYHNIYEYCLKNGAVFSYDYDEDMDICYETVLNEKVEVVISHWIKTNEHQLLKLLIQNNYDLNQCFEIQNAPLALAIKNNHENLIDLFLKNGASFYFSDENNYSVIKNILIPFNNRREFDTCLSNDSTLDLLIEKGLDINHKDSEGNSLIMGFFDLDTRNDPQSNRQTYLELLKKMILRGADVNNYNKKGEQIIHYAAKTSDQELLRFLINNGAEVDCKNNDGESPAFYAIKNYQVGNLKLLLEEGADVNLTNNDNETLLFSVLKDFYYLGELGDDIDELGFDNGELGDLKKPLFEIFEICLNHGADVQLKSKDNLSAMDILAKLYHSEEIKIKLLNLIIESNQNIEEQLILNVLLGEHADSSEIIEIACVYDLFQTIEKYYNEDRQSFNEKKNNLLLIALRNSSVGVIKFLIGIGAKINMNIINSDNKAEIIKILKVYNQYKI